MTRNRCITAVEICLIAGICMTGCMAAPVEERTLAVRVTVPDAGWRVQIQEVRQVGNELWVLSRVHRDPDTMAAQVITEVRDTVKLEAPLLEPRHFVIGKTWGWSTKDRRLVFIDSVRDLPEGWKDGRVLYTRQSTPDGAAPAQP